VPPYIIPARATQATQLYLHGLPFSKASPEMEFLDINLLVDFKKIIVFSQFSGLKNPCKKIREKENSVLFVNSIL
jgi:hypothetical protein